ncbi:hypothetical protein CDCA_CDCA08G2420 [Cyanidium caldarium]|uniref:Chromatin modification-related protein MEAF6 n=1 Tax=Cyanidium caldarium TaxID=2771 RepID=A0AAV9IW99_CYACA|nr:hypothetical protein CDCA_CDCA08G2420 [Cyanidium caldarium]
MRVTEALPSEVPTHDAAALSVQVVGAPPPLPAGAAAAMTGTEDRPRARSSDKRSRPRSRAHGGTSRQMGGVGGGDGTVNELRTLLRGKQELEDRLARVETQIYDIESSYLEETWAHGNVVRGWDGFVKRERRGDEAGGGGGRGGGSARHRKMRDADRIFSRSSVTAPLRGSAGARVGAGHAAEAPIVRAAIASGADGAAGAIRKADRAPGAPRNKTSPGRRH